MSFAALTGYQIKFGVVKEPSRKRKIRDLGIYGIFRHPTYFEGTFWPVEWSIIFDAAYSLLLTLWFVSLFLLSIVEEERLMEEYEKEYEEYIQKFQNRILGLEQERCKRKIWQLA
jgi:protein-S-isoprenylcysteine O-methyltransferase Ste14